MEFAADKVQVVECVELTASARRSEANAASGSSGGSVVEFIALEVDLPSAPILVHEVLVTLRGCAAPLLRHASLVRVDAARPAAVVGTVAPPGGVPLRTRGIIGAPAASCLPRRKANCAADVQEQMTPLVLARPSGGGVGQFAAPSAQPGLKQQSQPKPLPLQTGVARSHAQEAHLRCDSLASPSGPPSALANEPGLSLRAYGVIRGHLRVTMRWAPPRETADEILQAVGVSWASELVGVAPRSQDQSFGALVRQTLVKLRIDAVPLLRAPVSAAHLIPLLNAAQHLRSAGAAHHAEASEAELLAGLALMRSRKFVQCKELWMRCTRDLLATVGVVLLRAGEDERVKSCSGASPSAGTIQSKRAAQEFDGRRADTDVQMPLGCSLSISPFAHRISASFDAGMHSAIFLQILIAACAIEHSGGPLQDQSLGAVLSALYLATKLHLADLQATTSLKLRPLTPPYDAQTVLFALKPHVVHVLCAVVNEVLKSEAATQWRQICASALRCLDFVVQTCISCAFEPLVIDTIVRCFDCCEAETTSAAPSADTDCTGLGAGDKAPSPTMPSTDGASARSDGRHAGQEDGKEDLRAAWHHLVESCHDVLPSVSTSVLRQAAARLVEQILGSQGQRNWPSLHVHLLRLLMRITVLAAGDVAPPLMACARQNDVGFANESKLPFMDYLLRLLSAAPAEERSAGCTGEVAGGLGMPYVGHRCWDILRIHLLPAMPRRELHLFVQWLACSLSDSRSSYPAAQSLLLEVISDLARVAIAGGEQSSPDRDISRQLCETRGDMSEGGDAAPLRVHRVAHTVRGGDLQPLLRPLRDWLLLLTSKRDSLRGAASGFASAGQFFPGQADALARRPLSRGLLSISWAEDIAANDDSQFDALCRVGFKDAAEQSSHQQLQQQAATSQRRTAAAPVSMSSEPGAWGEPWRRAQFVRRGSPHQQQVQHQQEQQEAVAGHDTGHAQLLLLVWRTLVAVVATLPRNCAPDLHVLARPMLEDMRHLCLQGSPPEQALRVVLSVLKDLRPCDEQSVTFMKDLLLAFCDWIPHSVFDETFAVLNEMLRLLGPVGIDDHVLRALMHSMLNQYTVRSKSHQQSQQALVAMLMARDRPEANPTAKEPDSPQEQVVGASVAQQRSRHASRRDESHNEPRRGRSSADAHVDDEREDESSDGCEGDTSHFQVMVQLCFLGGDRTDLEDGGIVCDMPAPELLRDGGDVTLMTDLEVVERLQFISAVFRRLRYAHLVYIIQRRCLFAASLRTYIAHPLEKIRLLAVDIIQSICSAAFDRYIARWSHSTNADEQTSWLELLLSMIELVALPLAPGLSVSLHKDVQLERDFCPMENVGQHSIGTPAVLLSCCRLLHLIQLRAGAALNAKPLPEFFTERLTICLAIPLVRLSQAPWQLPRAAAISALLSWAPVLAWESAHDACDMLEAAIRESLVRGDCMNRAAALRLLPTLAKHRNSSGSTGVLHAGPTRDAALALKDDWSAEVCCAMQIALPVLVDGHESGSPCAGGQRASSEPMRMRATDDRELCKQDAWSTPRTVNSRSFQDGDGSKAVGSAIGPAVAGPWGEVIWDCAVYVDKVPVVSCDRVNGGRCVLDRFEDFLDACDRAADIHTVRRPSMSARRFASRHVPGGVGEEGAPAHYVDPDPELSNFLQDDHEIQTMALSGHDFENDMSGGRLQFGGQVGGIEDSSRMGTSTAPRHSEEVEDEEDLGIIDAGDEEWLEVLDVIRERSAVTIFNHTDSTWYVSNRHPSLVRPLHGKRRDPQHQYRQRSPSPSDVGVISDRVVSSPNVIQRRELRADTTARVRGHRSQDVGSCAPAELANTATSLQNRLQRRPHSAPNTAHERRMSAGNLGHQWAVPRQEPPSNWPAVSSSGRIGTHGARRPGSGSPHFGPAANPSIPRGQVSNAHAPPAVGGGGGTVGFGGSILHRSRTMDADGRRHYSASEDSLYAIGSAHRNPDDAAASYEGCHSGRASSPPVSEDDVALILEEAEEQEDGGSSSSDFVSEQFGDEQPFRPDAEGSVPAAGPDETFVQRAGIVEISEKSETKEAMNLTTDDQMELETDPRGHSRSDDGPQGRQAVAESM